MKKKEIKINFKYFWEGFDPNNNFFINLLRKKYKIILTPEPDFLFYSIYPEVTKKEDLSKQGDMIKKISPRLYILLRNLISGINKIMGKGKIKTPEGRFVKIFWGSENTKPDMKECDWAFGTFPEGEINNPRYMRVAFHMVNDYMLKDYGNPPIKKKINIKKIKKEKTKFCNFIYSQENINRNNFLKRLSKYKKIDSPGRCMNNMPPISHNNPRDSRRSANWVITKLNFLKPYKFTIAFENDPAASCTTEKLTHPMLVNSIPIYFGNKNVKKEFNTKSFINYNDFNNMKDFIKFIIKVDNDDKLYEKILKEPWYNTKKLPPWFNEKSYLIRFKEIFG